MIVEMEKIRIFGPARDHTEVLRTLQDLGLLHVVRPSVPLIAPIEPGPTLVRERRCLERALEDIAFALRQLGPVAVPSFPAAAVERRDLLQGMRLARRARRAVEHLQARAVALEEERALIEKYQGFFSIFGALLQRETRWPDVHAYHVVLRSSGGETIERLRTALAAVVGDAFELFSKLLPTGESALLILVAASAAPRVERVLAEAGVQEIPVPTDYGGRSLAEALPKMMARFEDIPVELEEIRRARRELARKLGPALHRARWAMHDRLATIDALTRSGRMSPVPVFVIEGWLPARQRPCLERALQERVGPAIVVEAIPASRWGNEPVPVVLWNPSLFRPFEVLLRPLPLPRYGTVDPTPFVALGFPLFFGLILGDLGYGLVLLVLSLLVRFRSRSGTVLRALSTVGAVSAAWGVLFGLLFGEFFGDAGRPWLRPLLFHRHEAVMPFLGVAVAIGLAHILLGLVLGAVGTARFHPRRAVARALSALVVALVAVAVLAWSGALPRSLSLPGLVGLVVAIPVLVVLDGLVAPVELATAFGNVLSYARLMALGTASVMLAVVANGIAGTVGNLALGIVLGLLLHTVNFALGVFSPALHTLRLHYVEFFGKFYEPGGVPYRPFAHWRPVASSPS